MKTTILLTIDHKKPIPELTDNVANRIYTWLKNMDASADVTAEIDESKRILQFLHSALEFDGYGYWLPELCVLTLRDGENKPPKFEDFILELQARANAKQETDMKPATWPGTDIPISRHNGFDLSEDRPSIFTQDASFNRNAKTSQTASESVEATRAKGTGPSYIFGVSQSTVQLLSKPNKKGGE